MKKSLRTQQKQTLKTRLLLIAATASLSIALFFYLFTGYLTTGVQEEAKASGTESIAAGSFIVNMGITPQTFANGLKPYGMIYDLTVNYNVPVKWVIEPSKAKDGIDFTHNSVNYKGGAFIVPAEYINTTINGRIDYWVSQGVQGNFSVSGMSLPVYLDITSFPLVMIDTLSTNDTIITKYYSNAGIPSTAYTRGSPAGVNSCHDMWVNPHGDPTWATHSYLYNFVTVQKSFIWMQCHAVSMMESCKDLNPPYTQLNYLTTTGLQCYQSSRCQNNTEYHTKNLPGTYVYYHPADPIAQFMGNVENTCSAGSERWFIPKTTGGWNTNTKLLVTAGTSGAPRQGILMAYGPAFGDTTNGLVMYMGGHDMNSTGSAHDVAAQRSFFNFLLVAGKTKAPVVDETMPGVMNANATDTFNVSVSGGSAPYEFQWASSWGGTFSAPNDSVTAFQAPHTEVPLTITISCVVTDNCGRKNFFSNILNINASALPVTLIDFTGKPHLNNQVQLQWSTASEHNNDYYTLESSRDGINFNLFKKVASKGNGTSVQEYSQIDPTPPGINCYYRLGQTDLDGTHTPLKTIRVDLSKSFTTVSLRSFPNPFNDEITLSGIASTDAPIEVSIFNYSGQKVYHRKWNPEEGTSTVQLDQLQSLASGHYILNVTSGESYRESLKITKK